MRFLGWAEDQKTVTYIWDIQDLEHPVLTGHYKSPVKAIDHNLYVHVRIYPIPESKSSTMILLQ